MKIRSVIILCLTAVILIGCSKKEEPAPGQTKAPSYAGQKAAALKGLTYVKGDPVNFESGKVYVVEFWATWCPPCKKSIPHLTEIQKAYKDKGVTVIGISNEKVETVKTFVEDLGDKMDYTVAIDTEGKAGTEYMEAYKKGGIPTAFVVNGNGEIAWIGHPMDQLETAIEKALANSVAAETMAAETQPAAEIIPTEVRPPVRLGESLKPAAKGQIGQTAASIDGLTYIKGDSVSFENGKVYVVEFWATWCGPCRVSIPHLTEIQKQFKDKGVTVIGISNEDIDKVKSFVTAQGDKMNYAVAIDSDHKVNDGYMGAFEQRGIPTAFIVDAAGKIAWYGHPMSDLDQVLETVVKGEFDAMAYAKEKAEREEAERRLRELYHKYFQSVLMGSSIEQSRPIAEQIITDGHADILNSFAWTILGNVPEDKRDLPTALKAAEKANTQTNGKDPMILDTYAMALFQNDKVSEAVSIEERALSAADGNERMQVELKNRLDEFKATLSQTLQQ